MVGQVTPEHLDAIKGALTARFFDVARLEAAADLIMTDAEAILVRFWLKEHAWKSTWPCATACSRLR